MLLNLLAQASVTSWFSQPSPSAVNLKSPSGHLSQLVPTLTSEVGAPPSGDEAVAEVEVHLLGDVERRADGLDVVGESERGAEQHQRHVAVVRDVVEGLVHFDFADGADLGAIPRRRQRVHSCHHAKMSSVDPPGNKENKYIKSDSQLCLSFPLISSTRLCLCAGEARSTLSHL